MGFKDFGAETLLSSDVDNYLMKQANIRCVAGAEPSGEEGMEVHVTDEDRTKIYNGSAWVRAGWWSSAGRTGITTQRSAVQSIPNATATTVTWDAETSDSDGFSSPPSGSVVVPSGLSGLYMVTCRTEWSAGVGATLGGQITIKRGSTEWWFPMPINVTGATATLGILPWSAGDTLTVQVLQTSGGSLNMTGRLDFYRIGA